MAPRNQEKTIGDAEQLLAHPRSGDEPQGRAALSPQDRAALSAGAEELGTQLISLLLGQSTALRAITQGEVVVIAALAQATSSMTQAEIAREVALTKPRVTQILASLEEKGLVRRTKDSSDKRRTNVSLTEKGRTAARRITSRLHALIENYLLLLGEDDAREAIRLVNRTAAIIDRYDLSDSSLFLTEL